MDGLIHIIILYSNVNEVLQHIKLLNNNSCKELELVIVVNKASRKEISELRNGIRNIKIKSYIFNPGSNLGYLNGAIFGYNKYCENNPKPTWITISNTDIAFDTVDFYKKFSSNSYSDDVWCVAPSVFNSYTKGYDNPEYEERLSLKKINRLIYIFKRPKLALLYTRISKYKSKFFRNKETDSKYIYSAKGCFFIIKNDLADYLDINKFKALLYSEESYIAEIVRKFGKKIYYDNSLKVIHDENAVTGKLKFERKAKFIVDSLKVIKNEFY